ncbi:MAG: hypothetical protein LBU32_11040 [Clostridiales bacterium]|jgi:hypothetical protein|nr:hypothetical protein [Clostridiales bacterium]
MPLKKTVLLSALTLIIASDRKLLKLSAQSYGEYTPTDCLEILERFFPD